MVYIVQSKDDLEKKIEEAGDKLVVIDFFASWCGPCKIIGPKLEELANQYNEAAVVLKVNVDDCEDIAMEYNITSMPTFIFIKDRQIIDTFVGGNADKLVKNMEKYVGGVPVPVVVGVDGAVATVSNVSQEEIREDTSALEIAIEDQISN